MTGAESSERAGAVDLSSSQMDKVIASLSLVAVLAALLLAMQVVQASRSDSSERSTQCVRLVASEAELDAHAAGDLLPTKQRALADPHHARIEGP